MTDRKWPAIIQGGMGIAVSHWPLARAVSSAGQLGVVSGTAIDMVLLRRLQDGDPGGHMRRALKASPWPQMAADVIERFFQPHGRKANQPYARIPLWTLSPNRWRTSLAILGGFAEVWLAKAGQAGTVGINLLTKVELPNLPILYGAMQAGVDAVLMGAGIPREIPGVLDRLAEHEEVAMRYTVSDAPSVSNSVIRFNPADYAESVPSSRLHRPGFFPIISAATLAVMLIKKATGAVDGFIVEGARAGGHNAPPRGVMEYDAIGQPVYHPRDTADVTAIAKLGYPFWLAGGFGSRSGLRSAWEQGANGIQVGTLFAYCEESGLIPELRQRVFSTLQDGTASVYTDPLASPTGFPFKVASVPGTLSEKNIYRNRPRICDLGYLRESYQDSRGHIQQRCAAGPMDDYIAHGGKLEDTYRRLCLCNGLMSASGYAQIQHGGYVEPPVVTSGDALEELSPLLERFGQHFSARNVVDYLLGTPGLESGAADS